MVSVLVINTANAVRKGLAAVIGLTIDAVADKTAANGPVAAHVRLFVTAKIGNVSAAMLTATALFMLRTIISLTLSSAIIMASPVAAQVMAGPIAVRLVVAVAAIVIVVVP